MGITMRAAILLVLLTTFAASFAAEAGAARPPLSLVTESPAAFEPLLGGRGVYEAPAGTLHVVDADAGTTRSFGLPQGCVDRGISLPAVLLLCDTAPAYRVFDSRTGASEAVDLSGCSSEPERISLGGLGRHWIGGTLFEGLDSQGNPRTLPLFVGRRSGECRAYDPSEGERDLNDPELRRRQPSAGCERRGQRRLVRTRDGALYLRRCGSKRRVLLCREECRDTAASSTAVAWVGGNRLYVRLHSSGRRFSWRPPVAAQGQRPLTIEPTLLRRDLYVSVRPHEDATWWIFRAKLPRR
jgi:hypothetical protein